MRTPSANFLKKKNDPTNKPVFLYRIYEVYQDAESHWHDLYLAGRDEDIIFQNQNYVHFPISHDGIEENTSGEINAVSLKVSNVSRLIQGHLELYELREHRVDILTIFSDLNEANAYLIDTFYIDSYNSNQNDATFVLTSKFDVASLELPRRKYNRNNCPWLYKGVDCKSTSTDLTCSKTLTACRLKSNQINFGGFASIPPRGIFVR